MGTTIRRKKTGTDLRWTGQESDLRRQFGWLARTGIGLAAGSRPIGWVQSHNVAAMDAIENAAKALGGDLSRVAVRRGEVYAGSKRLGSVREFYERADAASRK